MGELTMADFIKTQNSFARGEVAPEFFAHDDIAGLAKLENMDVISGGGLRRRSGLAKVATLSEASRIIPFSVSESEQYVLVIGNYNISVMAPDGTRVQSIISPWPYQDVDKLQYAQRFGTIIFVHPDYQPRVMSKSNNLFALNLFDFERNDNMTINVPFMKFDDAVGVNITITAPRGPIRCLPWLRDWFG